MKRLAAVLLGGLLACAPLAPAAAAPAVETRIVDITGTDVFHMSPAPWISGRLVTAAGEPVAGAEVRIEHPVGEDADQATGTTGADGSFSIRDDRGPRPQPETIEPYSFDGVYRARFLGTAEHAGSHADVAVDDGRLGTRLTLDPPPEGPYTVGETVPVTGTLELEQPDGTWGRPASAYVRVITASFGGGVDTNGANVADGRFSYDLPVINERREGDGWDGGTFFGAIYDGGSDHAYQRAIWGSLGPVVSDTVTVEVGPTVLGLPARIGVHAESPDGTPLAGLPVEVDALVGGRPSREATGTTDAQGDYTVEAPVWTEYQGYRVTVLGSTALPVTVPVTVSHFIDITGLAAPAKVRKGVPFTISGTVETLAGADQRIPYAGSTVTLAWSVNRRTWHHHSTQVVGLDGAFAFQPTAVRTAYWRLTAAGDDTRSGQASTPVTRIFRVKTR